MNKYTRPLIHFIETCGFAFTGEGLVFSPDLHERLSANHATVIWKCQGVYRLIPSAVISNSWTIAAVVAAQKKFFGRNSIKPYPIRWEQGIDISPLIVEELQREVYADHVLNSLEKHSPPQ